MKRNLNAILRNVFSAPFIWELKEPIEFNNSYDYILNYVHIKIIGFPNIISIFSFICKENIKNNKFDNVWDFK